MIDLTPDFVLQVQDEYTGGSADERGILFHLDGRPAKSPLRKPGSFYVFRETDGQVHEVRITCPYYHPVEITVDKAALDREYPVVRVRLHRLDTGVFRDCEWVRGNYRPGAEVFALAREPSPLLFQSAERGKRNTKLGVQGYTTRRMPGRRFFLGKEPRGETVIIDSRDSMGECCTRDRLLEEHQPGEPLQRAYRSRCDAEGNYSIPVEPGDEARIDRIAHYDEEKRKWDFVPVPGP
ncbi:MAG: hypothetical protein ACK5LX_17050 [Oscillospiraceae bacterium]